MGLDVYLYRNSRPLAEIRAAQDEAETRLEAEIENIGGWDKVTHQTGDNNDYAIVKRRAYAGLDVGEDGTSLYQEQVRIDSPTYPEHLFKIGYFRSSYNAGGINHILEEHGQPTLYGLMGQDDEYEQTFTAEDLELAKDRVRTAIVELRRNKPHYRVMTVSGNPFSPWPTITATEAKELAEKELIKDRFGDGGWSSVSGHFFPDGFKAVAFIPGMEENLLSKLVGGGEGGRPCVHVVYEQEKESLDFYVQALEIMLETIEYMLTEGPEQFVMHWSG